MTICQKLPPLAPFTGDCRQPTQERPGSDDRQRVMIARAEAGLPIFHPLDAGNRSRRVDPAVIAAFARMAGQGVLT